MEKRSWWRKKSSKHSGAVVSASVAVSANTSPVNRLSKRQEDHGMSKFLADQVQELTLRFQESEEKLRAVNAKLAAAQADLTEKEDHVKQHAKVAEEAVSGWEKAEEETASVKLQLDTTTKRLEDKISALDAAHKDVIRSSQKAREEHERKMQEMVTKKNKECERVRAELETRLSDVGHRLLESTAESKVLAATLQERMRTISELAENRSKAEAEINVLNVRLDSMDKDNLTLQYEIQVLNKQLQIRNEEKDYCKREADAALKQTQDGLKKIQFLEAECQRLRTLVRRKLPGPAAVAQMKQEVDSWGREERRRSFGSCRSSGEGRLSGGSKDFQVQLLTERVLSMEEETKMLREVLSQKNNELEAARMNFVAASMTPSVHSETASSVRGGLKPRQLSLANPARSVSETSVNNEDDVSAADAWTSSLITELDPFKKEKGGGASPGILVDDSKFQMMDDFAEMEQLAGIKDEEKVTEASAKGEVKDEKATDSSVEQLLVEKEEQLQAANRLCMEISSKLVATEKDFAALQAKNAANELSLIKLQEKLDFILEAQGGDRDFEKMFAEKSVEEEAKRQELGALSENIHKVICLVEALAHAMGLEHSDDNNYSSLPSPSTTTTSASSEHSSNHSSSFEKLTMASNKLTAEGGKTGLTDFIGELCAVLNMMAMNMSRKECSLEADMNNERLTKLQKEVADMHEEAKRACEEVSRVKVEKELLHGSCEKANQRLREAEAQLKAAEALVSELKKKLSQSSQLTADMEERLKAADGTVGELREKLMTAESKYESERERHQALVIRYEELDRQININSTQPLVMNGHANANDESNSEEIAAKLAECQETILALGKKLKVLSSEPAGEQKHHSLEQTSYSTEGRRTDSNDVAWSRIKIQGFEPETLTCWSPPRSLESTEEQFYDTRRANNNNLENQDSTWLYSPDHAGHRRTTMRSPGRFLSKKASNSNNELTKSVNFPLTSKVVATHGGSSFSRFFSRNRNAC